MPALVGIDHGFSFPLRYFEVHHLPPDWDEFLVDFQRHWPTDADHTYVDFIRDGVRGDGSARTGSPRWRRVCEERCGAKSVFHFDVQGAVAEVYPRLWKHAYAQEDRTPDQHDAYTVATWLRDADRDGRLQAALNPDLSPPLRAVAQVEGWILGVG